MNEEIETIILTDEDDNEIEFDIMDKFDHRGECYYVLLPVDDDSDELEYVILREAGTTRDGESTLVGIDDAELLDEIFYLYKKRNSADES